ncbi:LysE family translocator [Vibrio ponticus]|uniref:LysE family translocator n=1 Tax=Vibrio ponticus TaxID=265668 RepID=A0A3N3DUD5_9VIBR|nr:LysE family translocator [Vibrio ponticus]ROV58111.1 LysE family translocator [Vibrio ponticus]
MDLIAISSFVFLAALLVISPGPNGVLIVRTATLYGSKAAYFNILGFLGAFYIHGTLSILGISLLLVQSAQAFLVFKVLGAAYLCWMGVQSILSARKKPINIDPDIKESNYELSFKEAWLQGFITNALNPKVSMFYLAVFPQFISLSQSPQNAYLLVTLHACVNFIWFAGVITLLSKVGQKVRQGRANGWLKSVTGVVFVGFGLKLLFLKSLVSQ